MMPPIVPVPPFGAISEGRDQQPVRLPTAPKCDGDRPNKFGGEHRSEHSETEQYAVTSTVLRTRVSSRPRIRERHQRRADDIGELRGGIEDGGRERAFRTREAIAGDLGAWR